MSLIPEGNLERSDNSDSDSEFTSTSDEISELETLLSLKRNLLSSAIELSPSPPPTKMFKMDPGFINISGMCVLSFYFLSLFICLLRNSSFIMN